MDEDLASRAAGIGALADENRSRLYAYVVAQPEPVGREQAADALGMARHTASFHLDRLVAEGLLIAEFRRLTGRSGPGAGRPSKLYRRAAQEISISLPPRRYDLVGAILAAAVDRVGAGADLTDSLADCAREQGVAVGRAAGTADPAAPLAAVTEVLVSQGYEPRSEAGVVTLRNCPFDSLAEAHPALVCGINRDFVQGLADGLRAPGAEACLEPQDDRCCVAVRLRDPNPG